jgi:hypothetical protein
LLKCLFISPALCPVMSIHAASCVFPRNLSPSNNSLDGFQAGCLVKRLKIGGSLEDEEENDQDQGAEANQDGDGGGEGGVGADGNAADDMNNIITDKTVYIVNRGSLITTPFNPKLPISGEI